jgi:Fe-S cluster biogenesis protein NfuA
MANQTEEVNEVVDAMNQLVQRDGGAIELAAYQPGDPVVRVNYKVGKNDDCDTCLISPEMLKDFLLEGFNSRNLGVRDIEVSAV